LLDSEAIKQARASWWARYAARLKPCPSDSINTETLIPTSYAASIRLRSGQALKPCPADSINTETLIPTSHNA
jgi:hypothetical protein